MNNKSMNNKSKNNNRGKHNKYKHKNIKRTMNKMHSRNRKMRGGSSDCTLATVLEPSFNLSDIGTAKGLSIPESSSIIYRPNCKTDTYHPMVPVR
jgi:hypothetical protein